MHINNQKVYNIKYKIIPLFQLESKTTNKNSKPESEFYQFF